MFQVGLEPKKIVILLMSDVRLSHNGSLVKLVLAASINRAVETLKDGD